MVKSPKELSVAELERLLNGKKSQLDQLLKRREQLARELSDVEQKIHAVEGRNSVPAGRPATTRKAHARPKTVRPKNARPLKDIVVELLGIHKKGLGLDELSRKVLETGYKTSSTNFKNTLYQCLYNADNIQLDKKNGLYKLV